MTTAHGPVHDHSDADGTPADRSTSTSTRTSRRVRSLYASIQAWISIPNLGRIALRVVVASALFVRLHSYRYLDPRNAAEMLVGDDWTTYIVSPNYLDHAPVATFPIAEIPDYIAPSGTNLAMTDSIPILMPVYRIVQAALPGPIQLIGLILLLAVIGLFLSVCRFLDLVRSDAGPVPREVATLALATVLTLAPFWNLQYVHPALMHQWVIVWAISGAARRCPTLLAGRFAQTDRRWTGLGPIMMAAVLQPYLIPMVTIPALAPDVAELRTGWSFALRKTAVAVASVLVISVVLGYIGSGGQIGSTGFGDFAADLTTVLDPGQQSRFLTDIVGTPASIGGYGYVGLGGIVLLVIAVSVAAREALQQTIAPSNDRSPKRARALVASIVALTAFSVVPVVRIAGRPLLDFDELFDPFDSVTSIFRVNGRFVWVLLWFGLLLGSARVLSGLTHLRVVAFGLALAVVQVVDVIPWTPLIRPPEVVEYAAASQVLTEARSAGARSVEFQPPIVIPGCYPDQFGTFADRGDILLAAAHQGLPVNSGYTARLAPRYIESNCATSSASFASGRYSDDVVYILGRSEEPPLGLECRSITRDFVACRSTT